MKIHTSLWITGLAVLCMSANAQDQIMGPSPSSRPTLDLFAEPGAGTALRQVALGELSLPLVILESKASHHRIDLQGQPFWIKGSQVRIVRGSTAGCGPTGKGQVTQTIATPGAGKDGC
jgi:hypothetical protein